MVARPRSLVCIAAAAAAAILGPAPGAVAGLSAPRAVTPDGVEVTSYALATNFGGTRSALLYQGRRRPAPKGESLVARLGRGSALGAGQTLAASRVVGEPQVGVGPDGTVAAAWLVRAPAGDGRLRVAIAAPGRGFGRPQTLVRSSSLFSLGGVVVGARGRAVVGWQSRIRGGNVVRVALRRPGGRFGTARTIGRADDAAPRLAIAPSGAVVAAWGTPVTVGGVLTSQAAAAVLAPGAGRFGRPVVLSNDPGGAARISASAGPGGAAVSYVARLGRSLDGAAVLRIARARSNVGAVTTLPAQGVEEYALGLPAGAFVAAYRSTSTQALLGTSTLALEIVRLAPLSGPPAAGALSDRTLAAFSQKLGPGAARVGLAVRTGRGWQPARTIARGRAIRDVAIAAGRRRALVGWVQRDRGFPGRLRLAEYRR